MEAEDARAPLDVEALRVALEPMRLGHPLIYLPVVGSTNTHAAGLARQGAPDGTLVITDEQPEGRGRIGRTWRSLPRGQVLLSLVLRPRFAPHLLVMVGALAVIDAVEAAAGTRAAIKWPNDVLVGGRKVSGILIETATDERGEPFAIVGIGLNVNGTLRADAELADLATTLADALGHPVEREAVVVRLVTAFDALYGRLQAGGELGSREVWERWRARLSTLGTRVRIAQRERVVEGIAEGVDVDGSLLVRGADGLVTPVTWGDVS